MQKSFAEQQEVIKKAKQGITSKMALPSVEPRTERQQKCFDYWDDEYHLIMRGLPGTGKTFLALYFAISDLLEYDDIDQVVVIRSAVASRDLGFMGGKRERDKMKEFERPYLRVCNTLFRREDAWNQMSQRGLIRFISTSFLRGDEFNNAVVILDEFQNLSSHELHTVMTRIGENTRLILCGDEYQTDLRYQQSLPCLDTLNILESMGTVKSVTFEVEDIQRSGFVKDYILARMKYLGNKE